MRRLIALLLLAWALFAGRLAYADSVWTDANIVTGLDFSGSIDPRDAQVQIDGITMAIRSPQIIAAIKNGNHGRIGFAVFVWASGNYPILLTWRQIGSPEDAAAVADDVKNGLHALLGSDALVKLGALTDLSGAMDYGGEMLRTAPFATQSSVHQHRRQRHRQCRRRRPAGARPPGRGRHHHQRRRPGLRQDALRLSQARRDRRAESFALMADDPEKLVEVMARKFVTEIVFNAGGADQALR